VKKILFFLTMLPFWANSQNTKFWITASKGVFPKHIKVHIEDKRLFLLQQYTIKRTSRGGNITTLTPNNLPYLDAPLQSSVFYYYVIDNKGKCLSNLDSGWLAAIALIPYNPLQKSDNNPHFQWSPLQSTPQYKPQYQLQIASRADNWDMETGFDKAAIILDTIVKTANYQGQRDSHFVWSVKPVGVSEMPFFSKPQAVTIVERTFASGEGDKVLTIDANLKNGQLTTTLINTQGEILKDVELHYFISTTPDFTVETSLLITDKTPTQDIKAYQSVKEIQKMDTRNLSGYLLIIPSVNGVFLSSSIVKSIKIP
jgi:hypothetical protein